MTGYSIRPWPVAGLRCDHPYPLALVGIGSTGVFFLADYTVSDDRFLVRFRLLAQRRHDVAAATVPCSVSSTREFL